jgi:hypothetical protein
VSRLLVGPGELIMDYLPLCQYCLREGAESSANFEFRNVRGRMVFGCRPHWAKYKTPVVEDSVRYHITLKGKK